MKPSWIRRNNDPFELTGCWEKLLGRSAAEPGDDYSTKKLQVLILRQMCRITFWLAIIGVAQVILTCDIVTYR